jgi:hypothetical protein
VDGRAAVVALGLPGADADALAEALAFLAVRPAAVGLAAGLGLGCPDVCGCGEGEDAGGTVVPVALMAVLSKSVASPTAATALSSVVRQVSRESLRRPESRAAPRLRCLMTTKQTRRSVKSPPRTA